MQRAHFDMKPGNLLMAGGMGLMVGLLANPLRKLVVQAPTALRKSWDEALQTEHEAILSIVTALERTSAEETTRRSLLLFQLKHALGKHAFEEENTIYAMMRGKNLAEAAEELNTDHGEVKAFLFELGEMAKDDPAWRNKLGELRQALELHMELEEEQYFPQLRDSLSKEENDHLSWAMNKEGLKVA